MATGKDLVEGIKDGLIETIKNEFIYAVTEYFVPQEDYSNKWLRERFDWLKDGTNFPESREYLHGECSYIARNYNDRQVLKAIGLDIDPRDEYLNDNDNHFDFYEWCIDKGYKEEDYEKAKREYFDYEEVNRDFASKLLYDKMCEYFFDEILHELRNAVVNKVGKLMPYVVDNKTYTIEVHNSGDSFDIKLRNVKNYFDNLPIGFPLKDCEIDEEIKKSIEEHFADKKWTPAGKLRYMAYQSYRDNYIETVSETMARKYFIDLVGVKLSNGLIKSITDSAKEYFREKAEEIWKNIMYETEERIDDRIENIELTTDEKETLEYLRGICNSQKLEDENCYERELWKRREENLETILDRVLDNETVTV